MYSLQDLVLFNIEAWFGLYQTINHHYWPLHLVSFVWGVLVVAYLFFAKKQLLLNVVFISSIGLWLCCAVVFHLGEYQQLSWVAVYYGWAFIAQAFLLFVSAFFILRRKQHITNNLDVNAGYFLLIFALVLVPILGLIEGRDWTSLDVVGIGPDSTALATIGLILLSIRVQTLKILLCITPTLWLIISAATAWPMGLFQGVVSLFVFLLVMAFLSAVKLHRARHQ